MRFLHRSQREHRSPKESNPGRSQKSPRFLMKKTMSQLPLAPTSATTTRRTSGICWRAGTGTNQPARHLAPAPTNRSRPVLDRVKVVQVAAVRIVVHVVNGHVIAMNRAKSDPLANPNRKRLLPPTRGDRTGLVVKIDHVAPNRNEHREQNVPRRNALLRSQDRLRNLVLPPNQLVIVHRDASEANAVIVVNETNDDQLVLQNVHRTNSGQGSKMLLHHVQSSQSELGPRGELPNLSELPSKRMSLRAICFRNRKLTKRMMSLKPLT